MSSVVTRPFGLHSNKAALSPPSRLVLSIALCLITWSERHRTRRTIAALEPHRLIDIGLDPYAAQAEAAKPFWRA